MQKAPVPRVFLTILRSKNNWEKNSRKWEAGKRNGKISKIFDSRLGERHRSFRTPGLGGSAVKTLTIKYEDPRKLAPRREQSAHTHAPTDQTDCSQHPRVWLHQSGSDRWSSHGIVAGHARVAAAVSIDMTDVPTVRVDHLNPTQIRAYVIADNRLAEKAGWDPSLSRSRTAGAVIRAEPRRDRNRLRDGRNRSRCGRSQR